MRRRLVLVVGLLAVASAACGDAPVVDDRTLVTGVVRDADTGEPLAEAEIRSTPETELVVTGDDGAYAISLQLGLRYQVEVQRQGYEPRSLPITPQVTEDNVLDFDLALVVACTPGERRCLRGAEGEGVQTCAARGDAWTTEACTGEDACDAEAEAGAACRPTQELLVVLPTPGGVVRSAPVANRPDAAITCDSDMTDCAARYFRGTEVTLTATPLARFGFLGWTGACVGPEPTCTVTLTEDLRTGATFEATAFGLSVDSRGNGDGAITSDPAGIDCPDACEFGFDRDIMVTLAATPEEGSVLARWERDCSDAGSAPTCTLTMDAAKRARARFVQEGETLTVNRAGTGTGRVTSEPSGIDCGSECLASFSDGTEVTLTASAAVGSTFEGWTGDCVGTELTCTVTLDAARSVTATFDGVAVPLTVTVGGGGAGRITSDPPGIDCPGQCTASFGFGAQVELTATPDPDNVSDPWGLDCAPAGADPVCTLTLDAPRAAARAFEPFYLRPFFVDDANCLLVWHVTPQDPLGIECNGGMGVSALNIVGVYTQTPSRNPAFDTAMLAGGATEEGRVELPRPNPLFGPTTVEMTVRKDGPAFDGRGRAALASDWDLSDPATRGFRLSVLDDGQLVLSTRDAGGATTTASSAVGALANGTWYHVAATADPTLGLALFIDGAEVARTAGAPAWTASSSTAWVGAEREGRDDARNRFLGAVDEVRVSDVVRY